jgi:hypothetical protein
MPIQIIKSLPKPARFLVALCNLLVCLALLNGCASEDNGANQIAAVNGSNIQKLTNLYSAFQINRYGSGPKDEAEFKRFIKDEMGSYHLELMHVDPSNIDTVFISERDHKPFKVRYGVNGGPGMVNALVFEDEGLNGKKQVGMNGGKVMEVDAASYNELWAGKNANNHDSGASLAPPATAPLSK